MMLLISHIFSYDECERLNCCTATKHIHIASHVLRTVWQQFWVIFSHSVVIAKIEKWPTDIGGLNPGP